MATCKYCRQSGIFVSIDKNGLCKKCAPIVENIVFHNKHNLETNQIYLADPANSADLCRTITDIRSNLKVFIDLQNLGILSANSNPQELLSNLEKNHDQYYLELFQWEFDQMTSKIANMKVEKYQVERIDKFIAQIESNNKYLKDPALIDPLLNKARKLRSRYQK